MRLSQATHLKLISLQSNRISDVGAQALLDALGDPPPGIGNGAHILSSLWGECSDLSY